MAQPMWRRLWLVAFGAPLLVSVACSPAPRPVEPTQVPVTPTPVSRSSTGVTVVEAAEQYFNPAQLTVPVGATVVWNDVQGTHDMVADDKSFASAVLFEGGSYAHLFSTAGRYRYVCTLHVGAGMWAEVIVQ